MVQLPFDDEHAPLYSVGQVADMLNVEQAFLRRLDEYDVVRPARSPGGQRRYTRHEIGHLQNAIALIGEGMSLTAVRRIFELQQEVAALRAELAGERAAREGRSGGTPSGG
ncbi:DNA-binding transcriptional MerR regulator [Streptosporangium becharense]|uniref:DNA-binding transcriptional MerR regulator n=1 Tax=Streptosporangium becharense TaxID=1816182 RepID=A0A7W9IG15_9ACTN|nr:MerR family transcriptional regulator [Streptosporangium becharense]MBB2909615.1 DNA-binding transcriptional MerR regulator [Streptosporangium becharense]MBB5819429.1 DNA-binding transcriptional MerR regulator [Streptosporangium becharense]